MPLVLPNTFVNGENADAVPVEQNYSLIESYINNETIQRNGSVAMQAPLLLVGDPTQPNHAVNKDYIDAKVTTLTALDANKVNRSGDTMSGALNAPLFLSVAQSGDGNAATRKDWVDSQVSTLTAVDATKVNKAGDTMTGPLYMRWPGSEQIQLHKNSSADYAYMGFYDENHTTRRGWIGVSPTDDIGLTADTGGLSLSSTAGSVFIAAAGTAQFGGAATVITGGAGWITLISQQWITMTAGAGAGIAFGGPSVEYGRIIANTFLWGKGASNLAAAGFEFSTNGRINSTVSGNVVNLYLRHDDVNGQAYAQFAINDGPGNITADIAKITNGVQFTHCTPTAPSDYRWKDDLGPVTGALDRVTRLQPKRLAWKETGEEFEGFIAHEVEGIVPYLVTGEKDAVTDTGAIDGQSLDYGRLTTLLTAAVQELTERVTALEDA